MKHKVKKAYGVRHAYRLKTAPMRTLPDFLVIGAQKCGTTFLYQLLTQHPHVKPAFHKEVHYFDLNFRRGVNWYRSHFPLQVRKNRNYTTGESSPYYLFHPHAARRAKALLPEAKLIVLLRNPVDRAYSHYQHQLKRLMAEGRKAYMFEEAIEREKRILPIEVKKMLQDEYYVSLVHRNFSYLSRGIYVDQLLAWAKFFDRSQMLVVKSEDMWKSTLDSLRRVQAFLELPYWEPKTYKPIYTGEYTDMDPAIRRQLNEYYQPHNRRLCEFLGVDLGW
jgi:Sulfotransferase domain